MLFVSGVLPDPQLCLPPPLLQQIFFRTGAWSSANSNRDLPVCPLSVRTPTGVAFLLAASIRDAGSSQRDSQSESKLLAQAALFAHAWC